MKKEFLSAINETDIDEIKQRLEKWGNIKFHYAPNFSKNCHTLQTFTEPKLIIDFFTNKTVVYYGEKFLEVVREEPIVPPFM